MTTFQAFAVGIMTALIPSMLVLALLIWRDEQDAEVRRHDDR
jgi:hypothetical protein